MAMRRYTKPLEEGLLGMALESFSEVCESVFEPGRRNRKMLVCEWQQLRAVGARSRSCRASGGFKIKDTRRHFTNTTKKELLMELAT
ncbi:hypothetical protein FH972_024239 [Carpinus fangiana]|uniref:Uncharacterized protein n=1 Tax=Carpinus fangiana TaxID=176857 RepID=A0A5N6KYA9_9ROSI|nr:hypothetical protein FH972_024239 [Carpinus fangiana]